MVEHVAPLRVVVNIATQDDETVGFESRRFDRARGAMTNVLNLPDELASHTSAASDLAVSAAPVSAAAHGTVALPRVTQG